MSRLLLFSLTMVLAAALFSGCGQTETPPADKPAAPAADADKPAG